MTSKEVSSMIRQGFLSDSSLSFSPSRTLQQQQPPNRYYSPSSSPPQPPPTDATRPMQPTLLEMMSEENTRESKYLDDPRYQSRARLLKIITDFNSICGGGGGGGNSMSGHGPGDVRLTVVGRDSGIRVSIDVHRSVLSDKSRFFAVKFNQRRDKGGGGGVSHTVEISECDDVEIYVETVVLMYCDDLKRRLIGEDVDRVLALLKVCAAIMFDDGVAACMEYLEAVPWSEAEEDDIISHLNQLDLPPSVSGLLQRVSSEPLASTKPDDIFLKMLSGVLVAKDDKARREMKMLISKLFREETYKPDVSKDDLYSLCHRCLSALVLCLSEATTSMNEPGRDRGLLMAELAREADNLVWIVEILINRKIADEFVKLWADQKELMVLHSKLPTMYRHEISKITIQLCVAIGRGNILVQRETRFALLSTWLEALYEDFGWMKRASRLLDKNLIEDGLTRTILTLSLKQQQAILLTWFDRFLSKGDDCPNIQRAFEVWWRRAFVRQYTCGPGY